MVTSNDDYDSPWKEAVEHYFPEFIEFYFPEAYSEIDWSEEYVFLDQELRAVVQDAELGKRFVDKLVRVTALNGEEKWIYIHIEVQGTRQTEFAKRMFVYNYRIYDKYDKPVASLAVLADQHPHWRPDSFGYTVLGSVTSIQFPIAKLTDYKDRVDELLTSDNTFAIVTAAHVLTQRTQKNAEERYQVKWQLVRSLYERKWSKQRIIDLFSVIDWMMYLPEELTQKLRQDIEILEEKETVKYVTSIQRLIIGEAEQRAKQEGKFEGKQEGKQEGKKEGEMLILQRLLARRFGVLPSDTISLISNAPVEDIERWIDRILDAETLVDVFKD